MTDTYPDEFGPHDPWARNAGGAPHAQPSGSYSGDFGSPGINFNENFGLPSTLDAPDDVEYFGAFAQASEAFGSYSDEAFKADGHFAGNGRESARAPHEGPHSGPRDGHRNELFDGPHLQQDNRHDGSRENHGYAPQQYDDFLYGEQLHQHGHSHSASNPVHHGPVRGQQSQQPRIPQSGPSYGTQYSGQNQYGGPTPTHLLPPQQGRPRGSQGSIHAPSQSAQHIYGHQGQQGQHGQAQAHHTHYQGHSGHVNLPQGQQQGQPQTHGGYQQSHPDHLRRQPSNQQYVPRDRVSPPHLDQRVVSSHETQWPEFAAGKSDEGFGDFFSTEPEQPQFDAFMYVTPSPNNAFSDHSPHDAYSDESGASHKYGQHGVPHSGQHGGSLPGSRPGSHRGSHPQIQPGSYSAQQSHLHIQRSPHAPTQSGLGAPYDGASFDGGTDSFGSAWANTAEGAVAEAQHGHGASEFQQFLERRQGGPGPLQSPSLRRTSVDRTGGLDGGRAKPEPATPYDRPMGRSVAGVPSSAGNAVGRRGSVVKGSKPIKPSAPKAVSAAAVIKSTEGLRNHRFKRELLKHMSQDDNMKHITTPRSTADPDPTGKHRRSSSTTRFIATFSGDSPPDAKLRGTLDSGAAAAAVGPTAGQTRPRGRSGYNDALASSATRASLVAEAAYDYADEPALTRVISVNQEQSMDLPSPKSSAPMPELYRVESYPNRPGAAGHYEGLLYGYESDEEPEAVYQDSSSLSLMSRVFSHEQGLSTGDSEGEYDSDGTPESAREDGGLGSAAGEDGVARPKRGKALVCPVCKKTFKRDLTRHMRTHEEVARFICPFPRTQCAHKRGQFNRPYDFKKHLLHYHFNFDKPKVVLRIRDLQSKLGYSGHCLCGKYFVAKDWLDTHILEGDICPLLRDSEVSPLSARDYEDLSETV